MMYSKYFVEHEQWNLCTGDDLHEVFDSKHGFTASGTMCCKLCV